ncbi:MAG: hypothetical protein HY088_10295 [Ignavibacteriales bacterium]|nr:hypothetical protein [Ignavibacteriales bacterium]
MINSLVLFSVKTYKYFTLLFLLNSFVAQAQMKAEYRMFFTQRSALPDTSLGADVQAFFEDYDKERPLRSFSVDLNGDGSKEEFVVSDILCGSSNCTWVIFDREHRMSLGTLNAGIIYISRKKSEDYPLLETYASLGSEQSIVSFFTFRNGSYHETKRVVLTGGDAKKYFANKPPNDMGGKELK